MAPSEESSSAPPWLDTVLSSTTLPIYPLPAHSHSKSINPSLTSQFVDAEYHPALEAALHLAQGDLFSAHFLVRKAQGGGRELDWGHAVLHRLEGDVGNAKCWYTDLSNLDVSPPFCSYWSKQPVSAVQFCDLLLFYYGRNPDQIYKTTEYADKIKGAYSIDQLRAWKDDPSVVPHSKKEIEEMAQGEIKAMVLGCADLFGWKSYGSMEASVKALNEQKGLDRDPEQRVEHDSASMTLGGAGNRKY